MMCWRGMRGSFSVLVLVSLWTQVLVDAAAKYFYDGERTITEAKEANGYFETSNNHRIVEFYNPYCGHCNTFKSTFMEVVKQVQAKYPDTEAYGVNCLANNDMCKKFDVEGYPSVFIIPEDVPLDNWKEILPDQFTFAAVEKILLNPDKTTGISPPVVQQPDRVLNTATPPAHAATMGNAVTHIPFQREDTTVGAEATDRPNGATGEPHDATENPQSTSAEDNVEEGALFGTKRGSIPMRGAQAAQGMEKAMDQWREINREKRKRKHRVGLGGKPLPEPANADATKTMKAHRLSTIEYKERLAAVQKQVERIKRHKNTAPVRGGVMPFKKAPSKVSFVEKIPIIKRLPMIRMSAEEELILDASYAFLIGMRSFVHKTNYALSQEKRFALWEFLNVMSVALPPEWALHDTIHSLIANFDSVAQSADNMYRVLDLHPFARDNWSPTCQRSSNQFTCGFWKLLHVMTVGIAVQRGGSDIITDSRVHQDTFSPLRAADAIKGFMQYFSFCTECTDHFLDRYENCDMLRRCARLTDATENVSDADWKELAKWLWEFHNIVSVDILRKNRNTKSALVDEVKVLWPTLDGCFFCYNEDGTFQEDVVFLMLEKTYWPGYDLKDTPRKLLTFDDDKDGFKLGIFLWMVCFVIVYCTSLLVSKTSVKDSMIRARNLGLKVMNIQQGGKVRVV